MVLITGPRQVGKTTMLKKLMRGVQESLAGRVAVLSLTSLSQAEMAGAEMKPLIRLSFFDLLRPWLQDAVKWLMWLK